ncbi:Crp/Fnr family transcriptional regulator [Flavivirga abyssicola]|uniref:Crp/Fnr family transcriptional regulator n=1 Tax=Flavivirga abyssicola TaxID=3063533 RepID=UPI0026DECAB2|nr:Crp/Fnr family transcriptional regulator [Flavivirga sp. MEBiC07777]WVK13816.1 Crp/Fnr family transcriptional regulator [Flavivirga sp. MEBiC07777]
MELSKIENIITGIRKYYSVSNDSINKIANLLTENHLPKHHLLTKAGCIDNSVYFIEKGCTRTYFLVDGKEITNWFSKEGDITFSSDALYHRAKGIDFVELLEDSTIFSMPITALNHLYETDIDIANWSRVIHQEVLLKMQALRIDRLSISSKERYENFLNENPNLINRVNLGYIASYLGMTQQHLSTIRAS